MAVPVGKRRYQAFISHAHVDGELAGTLEHLLSESAGIPVWYDSAAMPGGATITDTLYDGIENSRALLLLLSRESVTRAYVQHEYRAAIDHQSRFPEFRIVPVRVDDVEVPELLRNQSAVSLTGGVIDAPALAAVLDGLFRPRSSSVNTRWGLHAFVSRGWHVGDAEFAGPVCEAAGAAGLQLVGDAEDRPSWSSGRLGRIMDGCGAYLGILPHRSDLSGSGHTTSKYTLREWRLAAERGLPCRVVAHPDVTLPPEVDDLPGLVANGTDLRAVADDLADEWQKPVQAPYVFFATDFAESQADLRRIVRRTVEAVAALPCLIGAEVEGDSVQRDIIRTVTGATLVLADVTGNGANVYIEVGAARATETPVMVLRSGAPGRPAFMLRDLQVWNYESDAELVAKVARLVHPYRRSLLGC